MRGARVLHAEARAPRRETRSSPARRMPSARAVATEPFVAAGVLIARLRPGGGRRGRRGPALDVAVEDGQREPAALRSALLTAILARRRGALEPGRRVERADRVRQSVRVARDEREADGHRLARGAAGSSGGSRRGGRLLERDRRDPHLGGQRLLEARQEARPRERAAQRDPVRVLDVRRERRDVDARERGLGALALLLEARDLGLELRRSRRACGASPRGSGRRSSRRRRRRRGRGRRGCPR